MKLWINGFNGRVGQEIQALCRGSAQFSLSGGASTEGLHDEQGSIQGRTAVGVKQSLSRSDVVLDFSSPAGNAALLKELASEHVATTVLVCTTGLSPEQKQQWKTYATSTTGSRLLFAPNTSIGVIATAIAAKTLTKTLAEHGFDIEISETHHRNKVDAPSGTALFLGEAICSTRDNLTITTAREGKRTDNEVGIVALRGGGNFGEHHIHFMSENEEVTLSHRALSRSLFAKGALVLAQWLAKQPAGVYQLGDVSL